MINILKRKIKNFIVGCCDEFPLLQQSTIRLNNYLELKKVFGWELDPILDRPDIYDFDYIEDVNERRIRDTETLAVVMRNKKPEKALEIGTSNGMGTVLMSVNSPKSEIYTVNIPPEEIVSGEGGKLTTIALEREKIGTAYKEKNLPNITQIYANTAKWEPDIGTIDLAFIDGCHDTDFVYNDTKKILKHTGPGSFIIWHDFNPDLVKKHNWIHSVCLGVEKLYKDGLLNGRLYYIRDSWMGVYKVG